MSSAPSDTARIARDPALDYGLPTANQLGLPELISAKFHELLAAHPGVSAATAEALRGVFASSTTQTRKQILDAVAQQIEADAPDAGHSPTGG